MFFFFIRKFNNTIIALHRDIEVLEEERDSLKQKLGNQSKAHIPIDISSTRRSMSVQTTIPTLTESSSEQDTVISSSPLLLAQVGNTIKLHDNHMIYPIDWFIKKSIKCFSGWEH